LTALEASRFHALEAMQSCIAQVDPRKMVQGAVRLRQNTLFVGRKSFDLGSFDKLIVIGGGKAGALTASAIEGLLGDRITAGRVIVPEYQERLPALERMTLLKSTHPLPSSKGVAAVKEMLKVVESPRENDLVLCLMSGGGSSLMPMPVRGVSILDKRRVTEALLKSGVGITELNCVRKHLSAFKGGRLAEMLRPATVISLIVSDVVGDDLASVASGPTVPDGSTFAESEGVLKRAGLWGGIPRAARRVIEMGVAGEIPETPKPGSPIFERVHNVLVGSNSVARKAASSSLRKLGYSVSELADVDGEARVFGAKLGRSALRKAAMTAVVAGGETVVNVRGKGRGGRNQEIALAASLEIAGKGDITILSFSTDGIDGPTDAAGALADGGTVQRGAQAGMSARKFLDDNDSYSFFSKLGDLVITGPTGTNVNDVTLAVVGPESRRRQTRNK